MGNQTDYVTFETFELDCIILYYFVLFCHYILYLFIILHFLKLTIDNNAKITTPINLHFLKLTIDNNAKITTLIILHFLKLTIDNNAKITKRKKLIKLKNLSLRFAQHVQEST